MQDIVNQYYDWLRDNTFLELKDKVARVFLPFLNHNNDYTEIYIIRTSENQFMLTDDGETLNELELSGLELKNNRKLILNQTISSFGMSLSDNHAIFTNANIDNLIVQKHMLIQCLLKVQDLFLLKTSNIKTLFLEDVAKFLEGNDIYSISPCLLIGKNKLPRQFDFAIAKSKNAPERLIKAINQLDNDTAKILIFNWQDTALVRSPKSQLYAFINNANRDTNQKLISTLSSNDIIPVEWNNRDSIIPALTA